MGERKPITRFVEVLELQEAEMVEGYMDGFKGEPEPGDNRSFSYWHGWRNGRSDRSGTTDEAQRALAHDYVRNREAILARAPAAHIEVVEVEPHE